MDSLYEERYNFNFFFRHHNKIGVPSDKYHFHDDYEIYISCVDNGFFYVNGEKTPLHYGDIYFFSNTDMHKVYVEKNVRYERYVIMFDCNYIKDLSTGSTNLLHIFQQNIPVKKLCSADYNFKQVFPELVQRLDALEERYRDIHRYGSDVALRLSFADFLLYLNRLYIKTYPDSLPGGYQTPFPTDSPSKVREIIQYIHTYYQEPISLDTLSENFFISKTNLNHLFRQYIGMSTKQYIINVRMSHAKFLLAHGTSVQDTCNLCGFNDYSHFIRTFTHTAGISPKQYALHHVDNNGYKFL